MPSKAKINGDSPWFVADQDGPITDWPQRLSPDAPAGSGWRSDSKGAAPAGTMTTNSGASLGTTTVTTTGSGLTIDLSWDRSVGSAPSGFQTDVVAAAQFIESLITSSVTINLAIGYGEAGGHALGRLVLGETIPNLTGISYAALAADLKATASTDGTDSAMVASLPATNPTGVNNYYLTTAQAKALGALSANATVTDGDVGFATASNFTYGDTNSSGAVAAGTYDFFSTAVHEITETMGRMNLVGSAIGGKPAYTLMDLTHYSAPGVRQFRQSNGGSSDPGGYASPDGGNTNIDNFNAISGGDAGDLAGPAPNSLNAFATPGVLEPFTANDATLMDMIGWNLSGSGSPPPQAPTGVTVAPITSWLAVVQASTGLFGGSALAQATETGGVSGHAFTYTLGGTGAGGFTLSSAGILRTRNAGVAGAAGGKLYPLAITANDTSNGTSSPAVPLNVVVGSGNASIGDTINLSTISGLAAASPTFIYGLAGNDTINGGGVSGALFIDAGGGADRMTGGPGPNRYEYGAATDSTPSLTDIIANFNTSKDAIDLTGIGSHLATIGALNAAATSIGAQSAGWLTSNGNTLLYVNTTSQSEVLSKANMEIELQGGIPLTAGNILHA